MINLKNNITSHGITLVQLAKRMGISQQAVSQTIHGNPSLSRLQKIADAIDIPLSELLIDDTTPPKAEPQMCCPHCGKPIKISIEKRL